MLLGRRDDAGVKRTKGGATPAVRAASAAGVLVGVHSYSHDPRHESFALEAAEALGVPPERVLKTLVAALSSGGELVVGVVPAAGRLDLKALAAVAGAKSALMADPRDAERATGYVTGGISPLGQRKRLRTFVSGSAASFSTVFVWGGRRGLEIELAPGDLVASTGGRYF